MDESKHTPGPWEAILGESSPVKIVADGSVVGYAVYGPRSNVDLQHEGGVPTAEANALLIAAAPEFLEACREFCEVQNRDRFAVPLYLLQKMRAAIKKATGEVPAGVK